MFGARGVRARERRAGAVARRAGAAGDVERLRCRARSSSLVRRNRRRYGGYLVHVGIAVLFAGVAASSAFEDARDVQLQAGPDREGRRLRRHVREADRASRRPATAGWRRSPSARCSRLAATASGRDAAHGARLLPVRDPTLGPVVALLRGRGDERGRPAGRPAARRLERDHAERARPAEADRRGGRPRVPRRRQDRCRRRAAPDRARRQALDGLDRARYANNPPPADFRLIVSPLVTWIWIGAIIVVPAAG